MHHLKLVLTLFMAAFACLGLPASVQGSGDTALMPAPLDAPVLYYAATEKGGISLGWSQVEGAEAYEVYRTDGWSPWGWIGTSAECQYTDASVEPGVTYYYSVAAERYPGGQQEVAPAPKAAWKRLGHWAPLPCSARKTPTEGLLSPGRP